MKMYRVVPQTIRGNWVIVYEVESFYLCAMLPKIDIDHQARATTLQLLLI